jgi:hypothetical protein
MLSIEYGQEDAEDRPAQLLRRPLASAKVIMGYAVIQELKR